MHLSAVASNNIDTSLTLYLGQANLDIHIDGVFVGATNSDGILKTNVKVHDGQLIKIDVYIDDVMIYQDDNLRVYESGHELYHDLSVPVRSQVLLLHDNQIQDRMVNGSGERRSNSNAPLNAALQIEIYMQNEDWQNAIKGLEYFQENYEHFTKYMYPEYIQIYLRCGVEAKNERWLAKSINLALEHGGIHSLCMPKTSLLVATAYDKLESLSSNRKQQQEYFEQAVQNFHKAREICNDPAIAAEWETYFLLKLNKYDQCRKLIDDVDHMEIVSFLSSWYQDIYDAKLDAHLVAKVDRHDEILKPLKALITSEEVPCRSLPKEFCFEIIGKAFHRYGTTENDYDIAKVYFTKALGFYPEKNKHYYDILTRLAHVEYLTRDFNESSKHYRDIIDNYNNNNPSIYQRYADSLMFGHIDSKWSEIIKQYENASRFHTDRIQNILTLNNSLVAYFAYKKDSNAVLNITELNNIISKLQTANDLLNQKDDKPELIFSITQNLFNAQYQRLILTQGTDEKEAYLKNVKFDDDTIEHQNLLKMSTNKDLFKPTTDGHVALLSLDLNEP
jgi:hypothetical protein